MIQTIQIKNEKRSGVCKACGKRSDRIVTPPLILPPDWGRVIIHGDEATWRSGPADNKYNLAFEEGIQFLRPFEVPHDPICWKCYAESLLPSEWPFVVNKPEIAFAGLDTAIQTGKQ